MHRDAAKRDPQNAPSRLSLVILTRDEQSYIGQTLPHLRNERDRHNLDFRIIVFDGESRDGTVEIAQPLADLVIEESSCSTPSSARARNIGAAASHSVILFHTDADVIVPDLPLLPNKLERIFADPNVVAVTTRLVPYPWDSTLKDRLWHRFANGLIRTSLHLGAMLGKGECQIVRKSAFDSIGGYDASILVGEDCDLFHRLSRIGRIVFAGDFCVCHSPRRFRQMG